MQDRKELLTALGKRIAMLRKRKKLSQTELGYLCDLDRQAMWRIESGKTNPTTTTLATISKALNISLKTLFDF
jgi:transcriptional regulator with XRE-family HTH domain